MMDCAFCRILSGAATATIVAQDAGVVAIVDLRQYHPGHVLVMPRSHVADIREADDGTIAAVFRMTARVARAVDRVFPSDGLSIWHSAGAGAHQEVPHLHVHVHPRRRRDGLLTIYPRPPATPPHSILEEYGARLREALDRDRGS